MIQRVAGQLAGAGMGNDIIVATGASQGDTVENQLGLAVKIVKEPTRRSTFAAVVLACTYLAAKGTPDDEPVIVVPCDTYADDDYFRLLGRVRLAIENNVADIVLIGIAPTYPSAKYAYIECGDEAEESGVYKVDRFVDKPDATTAGQLIERGALWNGGVFGFRLGHVLSAVRNMGITTDYASLLNNYNALPANSFDREMVLPCPSLAAVRYDGCWKDLGTWNTVTDELAEHCYGNVTSQLSETSYIINELELPVVCIGCDNMVVAASPDGILVSQRRYSENLKHLVDGIGRRPMYEERRWGEYKVIDNIEFPDGFCALTKQLTLHPGKSISYQRHRFRAEVWTFIDGEGEIVLDGVRSRVGRGDVINIARGQMHALRAITPLSFIEVQQGANLIEEDIERFPYEW